MADGEFVPAAYIPRIAARGEVVVISKVQYSERGVCRWQGLIVATSYPFGLAKKLKIIPGVGERLIWPENCEGAKKTYAAGDRGSGIHTGQEFAEGEVRAYTYEDDCRNIVWNLSEKGMGPMVRIAGPVKMSRAWSWTFEGIPEQILKKRWFVRLAPFIAQMALTVALR